MKNVLFGTFVSILSVICLLALSSCDTDVKSDKKNNETETSAETEIAKVTAEGIVVVNSGSYLIIENGSPIQMYTRGDKSIFDGLTTGDVIRIERDDEVMESFPGQVFIYSLEKISDGDLYDIPEDLRSTLSELGWIKERDNIEDNREVHETVQTEEYTYNDNDVRMSIRVPEGWECEEFNDNETRRGFIIFPESSPKDKLEYMYYHSGIATCGTDRRDVQCTLGGKEAVKIYYGDSQIWTFIVSGNFTVVNMIDDDTFLSLRDDIELIEGSVKFEIIT